MKTVLMYVAGFLFASLSVQFVVALWVGHLSWWLHVPWTACSVVWQLAGAAGVISAREAERSYRLKPHHK